MNSIISFFINSTLIFSFLFLTSGVEAQDFVSNEIDYSTHSTLTTVISDIEESKITPPKTKQMVGRESITFILGKDRNFDIPFYEEAFYYFANHPYDRTEYIITSCNSLLDVRNYLASFPTTNALPLSTINIVIFPTETTHLKVPIFPQGTKSDLENLAMVTSQNDFPSLTNKQIDQYTTLYIHGAEVEKDSRLGDALQKLLFGKENVAINPVFVDDSFIVKTKFTEKR